MVRSARLGETPAVRMKLFTPMPIVCRTKPKLRIWMNVAAYGRTSSVALENVRKASSSGGYAATAAMTIQSTMPSVTVLPRLISASFLRPSPKRSAASALPPLPTSIASAMNTTISGAATVAADRPISPMACPRKMESIRLYAAFTNAQDSRDGELRDEPGKGRRAHAGNALIALRLARRSSFRRKKGAHRGLRGSISRIGHTLFFLCCHMHTSCFNRLICHFSETYDCMHISAQEGTVYHAHRAKATASGRRNRKAEDPKRAAHAEACAAGHACCGLHRRPRMLRRASRPRPTRRAP